jgi:tetratricopeptide (TPR) repeat protein
LETAYALLRNGRAVEAEELMAQRVREAEATTGRDSPVWAAAQCDLGNVLLNSHQLDRALACYRAAAGTPAFVEPEARKDQLTYRTNLGLILQMLGRLEEAETELRANVGDRLDFYGREHAGYAFGLEPLADVLLRRGKTREARRTVEEAISNLWANGHQRVATALALRAEILKADGADAPAFGGLDGLPDELIEQMARALIGRVDDSPSAAGREALTELLGLLEARLGSDHQTTLNTLSKLANVTRDTGGGPGRVEAIQKVLAAYDRQGRTQDAVMAALGLAMAQNDDGDIGGALRGYADARTRAETTGNPTLVAQVLRNWGLALAEDGRAEEAEQRLREAVTAARRGGNDDMLGRSLVALGLFLQHHERFDEARPVVEEGLAVLDPADSDAVMGHSHLNAIVARRSCGCGDAAEMQDAIAESFRRFVLGRLPGDLLDHLDVTIADGDFNLEVQLRREPAPEELEHLNRVMQSALAEFRHRLTRAR